MKNILNKANTISPLSSFIKALAFYSILYTFWIVLFVTNDGPDGVEFQHIVMMGISYVILILIHGLSLLDPETSKAKEQTSIF